jgi:NADH dehydrogenase
MKANQKILILGAGFAGLAASKYLEGFGDVTVMDPNPSFEFSPNIHELVSGFKSPEDVRLDTQKILERRKQRFVLDKAVELDRENKMVTTGSGDQYPYDCLIVAIGGVTNDHGVPGVQEYSYPFKTAADCHTIGQRLADLERQESSYSVTIVGGGVEGVESLGEILRKYGRSEKLRVHLVEAQDRLLPGISGKIHQDILKVTEAFPVSFHFGERVSQVDAQQVTLSNGQQIHSDLTIWTGGVSSHPQLETWGLSKSGGWPEVNRYLQSTLDGGILILGDAVDVMKGGEKQAYLALAMGEVAGRNVKSMLSGKRLKAYKPMNLPSVYSFGNLCCFIVYKGIALSGLPFAGLKEAIYQLNMASIQDACGRPAQLSEVVLRGYRGALNSVMSLLDSPIPLFSRYCVKLSVERA